MLEASGGRNVLGVMWIGGQADPMGLCMFSTLLCGPGGILAWSLCHHAGEIQRTPIHLIEPGRQNDQASKPHIRP